VVYILPGTRVCIASPVPGCYSSPVCHTRVLFLTGVPYPGGIASLACYTGGIASLACYMGGIYPVVYIPRVVYTQWCTYPVSDINTGGER